MKGAIYQTHQGFSEAEALISSRGRERYWQVAKLEVERTATWPPWFCLSWAAVNRESRVTVAPPLLPYLGNLFSHLSRRPMHPYSLVGVVSIHLYSSSFIILFDTRPCIGCCVSYPTPTTHCNLLDSLQQLNLAYSSI